MERSLQKARPSTHLGLLTAAQLSAEQPLERVHRQAVDLQFIFNPCIDVTLVSIHIPPSMWGSNCEGYPFGLSGSWLPLTGSWVSAELATLDSGRFPDFSSWHSPNRVGARAQGGICAGWKCEWFPVKTESQLKNIWEKLPFISPS